MSNITLQDLKQYEAIKKLEAVAENNSLQVLGSLNITDLMVSGYSRKIISNWTNYKKSIEGKGIGMLCDIQSIIKDFLDYWEIKDNTIKDLRNDNDFLSDIERYITLQI